jgi:cell division transport system ATP-binding protein
VIVATNITLSYDNRRVIIENGNFHIRKKEFVFVSGASGSGKSTLLKALYGELSPLNGTLLVNNNNISKKNTKKLLNLRKTIGIVFQDYKLIEEYTIEENIMLPLKINGYDKKLSLNQTNKLLKHVKLNHRAGTYPTELSGGEQQRVAVARALAHNPSIIFADEPTGNLDDYSADVVWKLLKDANEQLGITVVVVTHKPPVNFGVNFRQLSINDGVIYEVS